MGYLYLFSVCIHKLDKIQAPCMHAPLRLSHIIGFATVGVLYFCAAALAVALFIFKEGEKK